MRHRPREAFSSRYPTHVTLRVLPHVWSLRSGRSFRVLRAALSVGGHRHGLRLTDFAVLRNHLHLVFEAPGREALARGMQGLAIRIARGLNRLMGRRGTVFADRYHVHVLRDAAQVQDAVRYVRHNHAIHSARQGRRVEDAVDRFSSLSREHGVTLAWPRSSFLRRAWNALRVTGPPRSALAALAVM